MTDSDEPGVPEVSVVVPTRDRRDLLEQTLQSALAQEDVAFEVIVVDDGSTDATAAWLARLGDSRVRIVRRATPGGVARARNLGIDHARAPWIALLDDDDLWAPEKLRRQLEAGRDADFVYTGAVEIFGDRVHRLPAPPRPLEIATLMREYTALPGGTSSVMVRMSALRRAGPFDSGFAVTEDQDMWLRLLRDARPAVCDEILVALRRHPGSSTTASVRATLAARRRLIAVHGEAFGGHDYVRWLAAEHRQAGHRLRSAALSVYTAVADRERRDLHEAIGTLAGPRGAALIRRALGRRPPDEEGGHVLAPEHVPAWIASATGPGGGDPARAGGLR
jgi:glycosyltransferase involved in cell wall biosynthesis